MGSKNLKIFMTSYIHRPRDISPKSMVCESQFHSGDVNSEKLEDEAFWHTIPLALDNGARRGTYRGFVAPVREKVEVMTHSAVSRGSIQLKN